MNYVEEFAQEYCSGSKSTEKSYVKTVQDYIAYSQETYGWSTQEEVIAKANKASIIKFINQYKRQGMSPYTINQKHSALNTFFKYLCEFDYRETNPVVGTSRAKTRGVKQEKDYLTVEEYNKLLSVVTIKTGKTKKFDFTSKRDYFMYTVMLTVGMRISEVTGLTFNEFNLETRTISIVGKGDVYRELPITDEMIEAYHNYMEVRHMAFDDGGDSDLIFLTITGKKISTKDCNKNLSKYCERAGIDKDITNHSLRHSCFSDLADRNIPIIKIAELAGHASTEVTQRYVHTETNSLKNLVGLR